MPQPEDNISNFQDFERTNFGRRYQDRFSNIYEDDILKKYITYSENRDEEQNIYMEKLDKRISSVDDKVGMVEGKVDKLRDDMPEIISTSIINIFKTNISNCFKITINWLFKALLVGTAGGIAWFIIELFKHWSVAKHIIEVITTI